VAGIQETFISFQQHLYAEDVAFLKAVKLGGKFGTVVKEGIGSN